MSTLAPSTPMIHIARRTRDVVDAWRLLYHTYQRVGYIPTNKHRIHTIPEAIHADTLVLTAHPAVPNENVYSQPLSTITAIPDEDHTLPLDAAYPQELAQMRATGRKLMEIGLFGCRDEQSSMLTILDLMRYVAFYAHYQKVDDLICGIPPHRAKLYARWLGFQPFGVVKTYGTVSGNPVILMRGSIRDMHAQHTTLKAVSYFVKNPLPASTFHQRFRFGSRDLAGSPIDHYLSSKGEMPLSWNYHPSTPIAIPTVDDSVIAA